jgi:serine/threonine-protein kinase
VLQWVLAAAVLDEPVADALVDRAMAHALADEDAGAGLCCGQAGAAYAALALHRATGEGAWLRRARDIGARIAATPPSAEFPSDSLWRGDLGVVLVAVELEDPARAAMPLYELTR